MAIRREKVIARAEKLVQKGKIEAAIKEYLRILAENPSDGAALSRMDNLYARIDKVNPGGGRVMGWGRILRALRFWTIAVLLAQSLCANVLLHKSRVRIAAAKLVHAEALADCLEMCPPRSPVSWGISHGPPLNSPPRRPGAL